jgi:hypothetical protein
VRIHITTGPRRPKPATGDRQVTKKHGLRIRVPEIHNGMHVVSNGRPCYVWAKPADLPRSYRRYLTPEERAHYFPEGPR